MGTQLRIVPAWVGGKGYHDAEKSFWPLQEPVSESLAAAFSTITIKRVFWCCFTAQKLLVLVRDFLGLGLGVARDSGRRQRFGGLMSNTAFKAVCSRLEHAAIVLE